MAENGEDRHGEQDQPQPAADPLTRQLRDAYQSVANEPLPDELNALLERLKNTGSE